MTKTFRGRAARASIEVLQLLNIGISGAAIATIVTLVYMEQQPSIIGWCFIAVGIVSFINHTRWFSWHLISVAVSVSALLSAAVVIFIKVNEVVRNMNSHINYKDTKNLNGTIFFIMGSVQVVILVLAVFASFCEFVDYYEDLEMTDLWEIEDTSSKLAAKKREIFKIS